MAAPKGTRFVAKSGPLAGIIFEGTAGTTQAYNKYQKARAIALGFSSYSAQRRVTASPEYKRTIANTQRSLRRGQNMSDERARITQAYAGLFQLPDNARVDRTPDGALARLLVALGRRKPDDTWNVGDTPRK